MLELFVKNLGELINPGASDYIDANSDIEYELELDCEKICELTAELEEMEIVPCAIENCDDFPVSLRTVADLYKYLIEFCKNKI